MSRLALAGSAALLLCAACDNLSLPAKSAQVARDTSLNTPAPPPKAARAAAERAGRRASEADPAVAARHLADIRRGLRRLVVAEETYYAENGVYTDDVTRIGYAPEADTEVRFLWLTRAGWAASGSHPDVPGRDCVIYVGRAHGTPTTMRDVRQGREGTPVCDAPPTRPAPSVAAPQAAAAAEAPATSAADTGNALDAVDPTVQMRVDLRNLVRSQDTYYGTQGVYSRRTEPFALQYLWHKGVTISILSANDAAWSARAFHVARPGKTCVIWLGPVAQRPVTEADKRSPGQPGTPACDS
jgi:hypothetical protein